MSISPESEDSEPCDTQAHLSAAEINTTLADGYRGGKKTDEPDGHVISE